ncbi:MAG TPA: DUF2188 domain-containing protein [Thermoanaerobaculia bacterium]|nr:DUF2188 domain-containing protein [Thermoanaerobaculia bacterium]
MTSATASSRRFKLSQAMAEVAAEGNRWHVISDRGRWIVLRERAERATAVFATQKDAVERAVDLAQRSSGEVIVHRKDATIEKRLQVVPHSAER